MCLRIVISSTKEGRTLRSIVKSITLTMLTLLIGLSAVFGYISEKLLHMQPPTGTAVALLTTAIGTVAIVVLFWKEKAM